MGFNRGEWSELYAFLYLAQNPTFDIVDENFNVIDNNIFSILALILKNKATYVLNNNIVKKIDTKGNSKNYKLDTFIKNKNKLLDKILTQKASGGAFEIDFIQPLIDDLLDGAKIKGKSSEKR